MRSGPGRRWLVGAVALFLGLFVLWILAVFQLSPASAGAGALQLRLRSNLAADYTAAPMMRMLRTLRLTVMEDVMRDMGMTDEEASAEMRAMAALLESPVPTATARSLMGEAPFTPTATRTPVPTDTPEPTATSTPRPRPTATETEKPTKKPKTATPGPPTATPSGSVDVSDPSICCMDLSPAIGGTLMACDFRVNDLDVFDPAFSAGIADGDVYAKYDGPSTGGWQYVNIPLEGGGFVSGPGSDWNASYDGVISLNCVFTGETIDIKGMVTDLAGNTTYINPGSYTMGVDCP
jgi:hypothetical protein